ncbi:MAG: hypothetical protein U9O59_05450 [Actinomycetota bacterium]|nr:hypothetical protein [Actinomycetota bacterium]
MIKEGYTGDRATKWMRWTARIWGALIAVYALIMLTGYLYNLITIGEADPYAVENVPAKEYLIPVFMFTSALFLGVAWCWEALGGQLPFFSVACNYTGNA